LPSIVSFFHHAPKPMSDPLSNPDKSRLEAAHAYPGLFARIVSEWAAPVPGDRAWLLYAANYLLRTGGVRWALDPLSLRQRLPTAPEVDPSALAALDYVVLTHRHADHLDLNLLRRLRDLPLRWIVPEFLLDPLQSLGLPPEKLILSRRLEPLALGGLTLTPFDGLHWEPAPGYPDGQRGVPALGYLAEFNGKRWLFPGDTRTYDATRLPAFGRLDGLFAHLWLGRSAALLEAPPFLDAFCRFCLDLQPGCLIITHLDEWGRPAAEQWTRTHARMAVDWFHAHAPGIPVHIAGMGDSLAL
jgi:hypothetical protein